MAIDKIARGLAAKGLTDNAPRNSTPGVYNWKPSNTVMLRKSRGGVIGRARRAKWAFVGDSKTLGVGAGASGSLYTGAKPLSTPAKVADFLTALGIPTTKGSIFGPGNVGSLANYKLFDARLTTAGSTWDTASPQFFNCTSPGTDAWSFDPVESFDSLTAYYAVLTSLGTFQIDVGGVAAGAAIDTNAASSFGVATRTGLSDGVINVARTTGGNIFFMGVDTWDSADPRVSIYNLGVAGWAASSWWTPAATWAGSRNLLDSLAADVYYIELGTNDSTTNNLAAYITNMGLLIDRYVATGATVILGAFDPFTPTSGSATAALQQQFRDATMSMALSKNVPMIDWFNIMGPYATSIAAPSNLNADLIHGRPQNYGFKASYLARLLAFG